MVVLYQNNDDVKKCVGMMDGLAFLPQNDVHHGVLEVRNAMLNTNPALIQPLDYFIEYYVGKWVQHPNGMHMVFQAPRFPMDMWNMYNATLAGQARTNNACEGWNSHFKKMLNNLVHPPLYTCLEGLQRDTALVNNVVVLSRNGRRHKHDQRQRYLNSQRAILNAVSDYSRGRYINNIAAYLDRISYHIRFDV